MIKIMISAKDEQNAIQNIILAVWRFGFIYKRTLQCLKMHPKSISEQFIYWWLRSQLFAGITNLLYPPSPVFNITGSIEYICNIRIVTDFLEFGYYLHEFSKTGISLMLLICI